MTVNDGADDIYMSPLETEEDFLACLAKYQEDTVHRKGSLKVDQQPTAQQTLLPAGSIVRYFENNDTNFFRLLILMKKQETRKILVKLEY